jgi:phospholipase D1/2
MSFFKKLHDPLHGFVSDLKDAISGDDNAQKPPPGAFEQGGQAQPGQTQPGQEYHNEHRFLSFAPERHGNETKWYVDGCRYVKDILCNTI